MHLLELPNGQIVASLNKKDTLMLYEDIFINGCYEMVRIKESDLIIDAGANIGMFMLWVASKISAGKIICLEPIPIATKMLLLNSAHTGGIDIDILCSGLDSTECFAEINYCPNMPSASSLRRWRDADIDGAPLCRWAPRWMRRLFTRLWTLRAERIEVGLLPLESIMQGFGIDHIDLLKMDIEGAELEVLESFKPHTWAAIEQVIVECHSTENGQGVLRLIKDRGYSCVRVVPNQDFETLSIVYGRRVEQTIPEVENMRGHLS